MKFKILNNDFQEIGQVDAPTPEAALLKAKIDPKIKRQCLIPMVEEVKAIAQDPRARMYRRSGERWQ